MSADDYNTYVEGQVAELQGEYRRGSTGEWFDPDAVFLSIEDPDGEVTTYEYGVDFQIVKDDTGRYHADVACSAAGTWYYRWWSTGDGQGSGQRRFDVEEGRAFE